MSRALTARVVIARLAGFLRPFAAWVALSVLLSAGTTAAGIGLLGTSAYVIAGAALHPSISVLQVAIVGVRFFGIARGLLRYGERLAAHAVNFRLLARLRAWLYRAVEPLAPARLVDYRGGDLLARAVGDIESLENFYVRAAAPPLAALLVTVGMALFTGRYDARLGYVLAGGMLLGGLGVPLLASALGRRPAQALTAARAELQAGIVDDVQGLAELLAYGAAPARLDALRALDAAAARAQVRAAWVGGLGSALEQLTQNLTLLAALLVAIPLVAGGQLDGVLLAVISLLVLSSFEAVLPLPAAAQQLQSSIAAGRRIFALADASPAVMDEPAPLSLPKRMDITIRGLTFRYAPNLPPALEDIDLDLPPGKRVALVGASGSGKTTLARLLLRFWDCPPGTMFWDGVDMRALPAAEIRARMAVVAQDTYLFRATVAQNLRLARPGASEADLRRALAAAGLDGWLAGQPDGLDTWLGEHDAPLSGGERQRLSLARAVLRDAGLVILDEPAAHLDPATAARVMELLEQALAGRAWLLITHELSGVTERVDEIVVLEGGRAIERGAHAELLASGGRYAQLWRVQNARLKDG